MNSNAPSNSSDRIKELIAQKCQIPPVLLNFMLLIKVNELLPNPSTGTGALRQDVQSTSHPDAFLEYCIFIESQGLVIHECVYTRGRREDRRAGWTVEIRGDPNLVHNLWLQFEAYRLSPERRTAQQGRDATVGVFESQLIDSRVMTMHGKLDLSEYLDTVRYSGNSGGNDALKEIQSLTYHPSRVTLRAVIIKLRTYLLPNGVRVIESRIALLSSCYLRVLREEVRRAANRRALTARARKCKHTPFRRSVMFWLIRAERGACVQFPATDTHYLN